MKASYVIKRILLTLFIFFVVVTLCFFIPRIGVDDPAARYYPAQTAGTTDAEYEYIKEQTRIEYGLNGTTFEQYIRYLGKLFTGDLGKSYTKNEPVIDLIAERLPWTLVLSVSNLLISLIIGVIIGTMAAWRRGRWQDRALLNASTFTTALPAFFLALILSFLLGFEWEIFPAYTDQNMVAEFAWNWESISRVAYNAALPIFAMAIGSIVSYGQATRNSVIAVSEDDFILTAKAKGLSNNKVIYGHTLRNALLPIVTQFGMNVSTLIGGAVVIEQIFNWNGMGTLFLTANSNNDYPLMMGIMIFMSAFALVANLLTDFVYCLLDPRVTLGGR
ncbi:MAG TPA: ABC transporter permease [Candidatus Borkfalkia faecigallinarum]|uniref:ABC transporter permease n=1 Tax=Candidatus Borkfalkia faecigallinarum TaxID=2838509 RepID=A0A9D2ARL8_9FIRM|nr:ABC transporter permease [Candidatus Borkfalkia faecigallinarum]